ncbi:maleylpyruvate isomerase N-terminal domain-containing protein [Mycobacterium sp. Root135]|uniref:maleylpyruvate isomerase N-terminal domain-containing protein n=1 Tax=Mycobacterium sp. Root135 TaxID=1736457 RepID=UPI000B046C0F|nr:maleylpyruvate isomerase N-terminal domain-containing protein [Mycobacterium sp. Root135]
MSTTFRSAATTFADLVHAIPESSWDGPGLGDWDLRALVGHASRSLITVSTYLRAPADREDVTSPADYYSWVHEHLATADAGAIVERGRQAGRDLGAQPAASVDSLLERALADVAAVEDPLITVIGGLGLRLSTYLPTRVFELAVHGLDVARAVGLDFTLPEDVLAEATVLAARISVRLGSATPVLLALTGREQLPSSFSVV